MNDVDVRLRARAYALRHLTPDVQLIHTSARRAARSIRWRRNRFIRRWDIFGTSRIVFPRRLLLLGETMFYLRLRSRSSIMTLVA